MAENSCDLVASLALNVHEERVGALNQSLLLVGDSLQLGVGIQKVTRVTKPEGEKHLHDHKMREIKLLYLCDVGVFDKHGSDRSLRRQMLLDHLYNALTMLLKGVTAWNRE